MNAKRYIKDYIKRSSPVIDNFFKRKIKEVGSIGQKEKGLAVAVDMFNRFWKFVSGGKRLRGSWIQLGYELAGGNKDKVLEASTSIEIIHGFLLMHDDIQDMDILRRGLPTIHRQYEEQHKNLGLKKSTEHFGISMGINMGDLGAYLGMEVLLEAALLNERGKLKAATYLSRLLQKVAYGQGLDVTYEHLTGITEKDVLDVHLHKTSVYTVGGPLTIGGLLGDLDTEELGLIEKFGEPVGIAFQLRDDELGLFSEEETLGKPIGSDVREGKNTVLRIKAFERARAKDRQFLEYAYGNRRIKKSDVYRIRDITLKTGALEYSQKLSKELVDKGKRLIPKISKDHELQNTLASMADFMIQRES